MPAAIGLRASAGSAGLPPSALQSRAKLDRMTLEKLKQQLMPAEAWEKLSTLLTQYFNE